MRIGIDATHLREDRLTGVERYTLELIQSLLKSNSNHEWVIFLTERIHAQLVDWRKFFKAVVCPIKMRVIKDQLWLPSVASRERLDILHCPAFPAPLFYAGTTILTIHDATLWRYPQMASRGGRWYYRPLFDRVIPKARLILTVSESARQDLMQYAHIPPDKISTVYQAPAAHFMKQHCSDAKVRLAKRKYGLPEQYLLTVGTIEPRKNMAMLVQAWKQIRRDHPDVALVVAGRQGWQRAWPTNGACPEGVIMTGAVEDHDLPALYRGACAVVIPSWYEGFGLPLVEAMACGVPVVASNRPALPEIGGDACLYADPANPNAWATQITRVLNEPGVAQECIVKGLQRVRRFSWEQSALTILQLYEQIAMSNQDTRRGQRSDSGNRCGSVGLTSIMSGLPRLSRSSRISSVPDNPAMS